MSSLLFPIFDTFALYIFPFSSLSTFAFPLSPPFHSSLHYHHRILSFHSFSSSSLLVSPPFQSPNTKLTYLKDNEQERAPPEKVSSTQDVWLSPKMGEEAEEGVP